MASSSSSALSDVSHSCSDKSSPAQNKNDVRIEHTVLEEGKSADADVENEGQEGQGANLPRADGGGKAWLFLAGCFVFEALIWGKSIYPSGRLPQIDIVLGFPFSFGVFQSYYTTHPPFVEHAGSVAVIGTCSTGVMYLFAPVSLYVLEAWPSIRRRTSVFGLMLIVSTLMASSFSTAVWHLILTQGVLYAIGGSLLYAPTVFYLDEWFVKKKGLAFGIMWGGVGMSSSPHFNTACANKSRHVRSRFPLPAHLPPQQLRLPHDPPHLVHRPPRSLRTANLLRARSSSYPNLTNSTKQNLISIPTNSLLRRPPSFQHPRIARLLPPLHLPPLLRPLHRSLSPLRYDPLGPSQLLFRHWRDYVGVFM